MLFVAGLAVLAVVVFLLRAFLRAQPVALARRLRIVGALGLLAVALALVLARQFAMAAMAAAAAVTLFERVTARVPGGGGAPGGPRPAMTHAEARRILGVGPDASRAHILAAHRSMMKLHHPDQGGTTEAAARLNAARDLLLGV